MNSSRELAVSLHNQLNPNVPLSVVERRVWMLKCRHIPDKEIAGIIESELLNADGEIKQDDEDGIIVDELPDEWVVQSMDDWR